MTGRASALAFHNPLPFLSGLARADKLHAVVVVLQRKAYGQSVNGRHCRIFYFGIPFKECSKFTRDLLERYARACSPKGPIVFLSR